MKNNLSNFFDNPEIYKIIFDSIPLHIIITDPDGKIVMANKSVEKITGFTQKEIIGKNPKLWGQQMDKAFYKEFWAEIKDKKHIYSGIIQNKKKTGVQYHAAVKVTPILDKNDKLLGFCGIEQDITEIQKLSDEHDLSERHKNILKRSVVIK